MAIVLACEVCGSPTVGAVGEACEACEARLCVFCGEECHVVWDDAMPVCEDCGLSPKVVGP